MMQTDRENTRLPENPALWSGGKYDVLWCVKIRTDDLEGEKRLYALDEALLKFTGRRHFILAVADVDSPSGFSALGSRSLKHGNQMRLLAPDAAGLHHTLELYLQTACEMQADLICLPSDFPLDEQGKIPSGVLETFLDSLQETCDLVVGFSPSVGVDAVEQCCLAPTLEVFYGVQLPGVLGKALGIRLEFAEELHREAGFFARSLPEPGMLFWLLTRAVLWKKRIRTFFLSGLSEEISSRISSRNLAGAVMQCIRNDERYCLSDFQWMKKPECMAQHVLLPTSEMAGRIDWLQEWQQGFSGISMTQEETAALPLLWQTALTAHDPAVLAPVTVKDWADLQLWLLMDARTDTKKACDRALDIWEAGFFSLLLAELSGKLPEHPGRTLQELRRGITGQLRRSKQENLLLWKEKAEKQKEALVPMYYMEYVPGQPIVIPKNIQSRSGEMVETESVYRALRQQFERKMQRFLQKAFGRTIHDSPSVLKASLQGFSEQAEELLEELFPGSLYTRKGLLQFTEKLWDFMGVPTVLTVQENLQREMLMRFPPVNLMLALDVDSPLKLMEMMDVKQAIACSQLLEEEQVKDACLVWLGEHLRPDRFQRRKVATLILEEDWAVESIPFGRISSCDKITGAILLRPLKNTEGGRYPRLRYFFELLRRMTQLMLHSELALQCIQERRSIGTKFLNCLKWSPGGEDFSAAQIFENTHHRRVCQMIKTAAFRLKQRHRADAARIFRLMAQGYGVSQVLKDGSFLTCTVWSWAAYSFKGGSKTPHAFTTRIENRWFKHEFLTAVCRKIGFSAEELARTVRRQIISGRSRQELFRLFIPAHSDDVEVLVQTATEEPAGVLVRCSDEPIVKPVPEHDWENRYVLNPGALRLGDKVYLFYRAVGEDEISRIGLAVTDGYRVLKRLAHPIFSPETREEKRGCEDPRVILLEDTIWMLYTAYDGNVAQVAAATLSREDFLQEKFNWKRQGLAFQDVWDKDAILFPEKIQGTYALYHRIEPSIWYTALPELQFPCRERQTIILGPRPGQQWDSLKIGAGAQPLKTVFGWLLFYHGVDQNYVYRLGILLVDLQRPENVLYRSPNAVLEPVTAYELGGEGDWVPNVVFTCGAVGAMDKEILEEEDEVLVYYGAADSSIGVASARISELIPARYRKRNFD